MSRNRQQVTTSFIAAFLTLSAFNGFSESAAAGPALAPEQVPSTRLLLAQMRGTPITPTPIGPTPIHPIPINPIPINPTPISPTPISPTPISPTPIITNPITPPGPGGGTPYYQIRFLPGCVVASTNRYAPNDCSTRFINYQTLRDEFRLCTNGRCFAGKFLDIAKAPMIVVYPQAQPARAAAQAEVRAVMAEGVRAMGSTLRQRVNNGASGLPSLAGIDDLIHRASEEIDRIDQPTNESMEERLRRLGLGPATRSMATKVRDS